MRGCPAEKERNRLRSLDVENESFGGTSKRGEYRSLKSRAKKRNRFGVTGAGGGGPTMPGSIC